jgi:hypothetical protein
VTIDSLADRNVHTCVCVCVCRVRGKEGRYKYIHTYIYTYIYIYLRKEGQHKDQDITKDDLPLFRSSKSSTFRLHLRPAEMLDAEGATKEGRKATEERNKGRNEGDERR